MGLSFKEYLIEVLDAEGDADPEQMVQRAKEHHSVNLTAPVRRIMQNLDLTAEPDPNDLRSYTVFDLYLALDTLKSAIQNQLNVSPDEQQGDANTDYSQLWTSIGEEAKDAIQSLFRAQSGQAGDRAQYPRFVSDFNKLVIPRVIKALQNVDPAQARTMVDTMIESGKNAVNSNLVQYTDIPRGEAARRLRHYNRAHMRQLAHKGVSELSRNDRLRVIQDVARRLHAPADEEQQ